MEEPQDEQIAVGGRQLLDGRHDAVELLAPDGLLHRRPALTRRVLPQRQRRGRLPPSPPPVEREVDGRAEEVLLRPVGGGKAFGLPEFQKQFLEQVVSGLLAQRDPGEQDVQAHAMRVEQSQQSRRRLVQGCLPCPLHRRRNGRCATGFSGPDKL